MGKKINYPGWELFLDKAYNFRNYQQDLIKNIFMEMLLKLTRKWNQCKFILQIYKKNSSI